MADAATSVADALFGATDPNYKAPETIDMLLGVSTSESCQNGGAAGNAPEYVTCDGYVAAAKSQARAIRSQWIADVGVQLALATWNRYSSGAVAGLQQKLANQQMRMAEDVMAHGRKFYPYEKKFLEEAMNAPKYEPKYCATSEAWGGKMDSDLSEARTDFINAMNSMCMPIGRCQDARWLRNAALRSIDTRNYALRQEENRAQALNDQRYSWQYSALGLSKGKLREVASFSALSGTVGMNAAKLLSDGLNALGGSIGNWFMSAAPPKYSITDEPQVYMPNAGTPTPTPVQQTPEVPCRTRDRYWNSSSGKWEWADFPCDAIPGMVIEAKG